MQDYVEVTGMVLKAVPVLETDKKITILTKEQGKIIAFARGAKKAGSRFMASTEPFAYGTFQLHAGRAYNVTAVHIEQYFETLRADYEGAFYGMYFADIADYFGRENNDERGMLGLLYASLMALSKDSIPNPLVQCIYEMKVLAVNGEFPGILKESRLSEAAAYTIRYVESAPLNKLYTFTVSETVLKELAAECEIYRSRYIGKKFKSLEVLENCRLKI